MPDVHYRPPARAPAGTPLLTAATVRGWQAQRAVGDRRLAPCFRRPEARPCHTPYGFQHLLGRAVWSAEAARDALYAYVAEHLGAPEGVVVLDETGFPKQGAHSAGVARPYCGTRGQVGNCQVGVFLAYVGARGHALLDRELYLPRAWTNDPARLQAVELVPDTPFATQP